MKKFKRLNRKGFTLIELLAVIVILAIVIGIAGNSVLNSINNSRRSSLYSSSQNVSNIINTWAAEDSLVQTDNKRKLGSAFETTVQGTTSNGGWVCLTSLQIQNASGSTTKTSLITALGLSDKDIILGTKTPTYSSNKTGEPANDGTATGANNTCSAIRYNKSAAAYEILLNAKVGGKYYVSTDTKHYAFSRATGENLTLVD